jgi:hypothetical protein
MPPLPRPVSKGVTPSPGYLWVLYEVPAAGPPHPVGSTNVPGELPAGSVGGPAIEASGTWLTAEGGSVFPLLFDAALAKGVENAIIRALNSVRVAPDLGRHHSPAAAPGRRSSEEVPDPVRQATGTGLAAAGAVTAGGPNPTGEAPNFAPSTSHAPLERIWYSGAAADPFILDFATDPPTVSRRPQTGPGVDTEGTASLTDPATGRLRLYIVGRTIFNGQTHAPLEDGTSSNAPGPTAGSPLIVPAPGANRDLFCLLTNPGGRVSYSIADLSEGPKGRVLIRDQSMGGESANALGVVPHADGRSLWLLTCGPTARLDAYVLDAASGVAVSPVSSPMGIDGPIGRCSIVHSPDGDVLAFNVEGRGLATARFDRATGKISGVKVRVLGCVGPSSAFSPDGTKLYFAAGHERTPRQLDLGSDKEVTLSSAGGFGGPKLGPDGRIYWTGLGKPFLSVVEDPDATGESARFRLWGVGLRGARGASDFPNQTAAFLDYLPPALRKAGTDRATSVPPGGVRQEAEVDGVSRRPAAPAVIGPGDRPASRPSPGQVAADAGPGQEAPPGPPPEASRAESSGPVAAGSPGAGRPDLAGRTIFLDGNGNGRFDLGEPWTIADQFGRYQLPGPGPGTYVVPQPAPAGAPSGLWPSLRRVFRR